MPIVTPSPSSTPVLETANPHKLTCRTPTAVYYILGGLPPQLDSLKLTLAIEHPQADHKSRHKADLYEDRQQGSPLLAIRNRVLMGLLVWQGLRPEELGELTTDNIDLDAGGVQVKATSVTNGRRLPLQPQQVLLLLRYMEQVRPKLLKGKASEKLLVSQRGNGMGGEDITKYIKRRYRGLYHPRIVNCMTVRQSVIANMLKSGKDLRVVQVFVGHKYPSSTERYRQRDAQALKEAIEQYHPVQ